ncbi:hypothetical protein [Leptospira wolffii]|uniref:hypothetical protein n=1 Tax=Leptospira wolffii TaxID=409998 RepID=UPI000590E5C9|nr:hypothetical protein [Leptospira wolffii]
MFTAITASYALFAGIPAAIELEAMAEVLGGDIAMSTIIEEIFNMTVGITFVIFSEIVAVLAAIGLALLAVIELMELTGSSAAPNGGGLR